MKKKSSSSSRSQARGPDLFSTLGNRRRRVLLLARFVADEANSGLLHGKKQDRSYEILCKWADLEAKRHLDVKETAIAARHGRTVSQIIFRFALDIGIIPLTGTSKAEHMRADLEVFDFRLQPEEVERIEGLVAP